MRRTCHTRLKAGATGNGGPRDYEFYDNGIPDGYMTEADRQELAVLLGLESVHIQGESIPAGLDYYREYLDRANGRVPTTFGKQYWD